MENSKIEWCNHTFNPWWGCSRVSPGCDHCYAATLAKRMRAMTWETDEPRQIASERTWVSPLDWDRKAKEAGKPARVFCGSMMDVFDNHTPDGARERLFRIIKNTPDLRWMLLTKRIGNAAKMLPPDWPGAYPNAGLMATVVNQTEADRDIPKLLAIPAAWHGISAEPLLGGLDLRGILARDCIKCEGTASVPARGGGQACPRCFANGQFQDPVQINLVIVGGESGPGARPMHPDWVRSVRDQCKVAQTPFHFKQWGEWGSTAGGKLVGVKPGSIGPNRVRYIVHDGTTFPVGEGKMPDGKMDIVFRVGKHAAGRKLDGRTHDETIDGMQ